jgi:hypothetical protein
MNLTLINYHPLFDHCAIKNRVKRKTPRTTFKKRDAKFGNWFIETHVSGDPNPLPNPLPNPEGKRRKRTQRSFLLL